MAHLWMLNGTGWSALSLQGSYFILAADPLREVVVGRALGPLRVGATIRVVPQDGVSRLALELRVPGLGGVLRAPARAWLEAVRGAAEGG